MQCLLGSATHFNGGCKVGILFSGGIDSVLLAALLHEILPMDEPIDLLNVTFDGHGAKAESASDVFDDVLSLDGFKYGEITDDHSGASTSAGIYSHRLFICISLV